MVKTPHVVLLSIVMFSLGLAFGMRHGDQRSAESSRRIYGVVSEACQQEIDDAARDPDLHAVSR